MSNPLTIRRIPYLPIAWILAGTVLALLGHHQPVVMILAGVCIASGVLLARDSPKPAPESLNLAELTAQLFDSYSDQIAILDREGTILCVNKA